MPTEELLVHISGPSTNKDDARYRKMAREYDGFEVAERVWIGGVILDVGLVESNEPPDATASFDLQLHYQLQNQQPGTPDVTKSQDKNILPPVAQSQAFTLRVPEYVDDTQAAGIFLESQLFTSSLRALSSPPDSITSSPENLDEPQSGAQDASKFPEGLNSPRSPLVDANASSLDLSLAPPVPLAPRTRGANAPIQPSKAGAPTIDPPSVEILSQPPPAQLPLAPYQFRSPRPLLNAQIATSSTLSAPPTNPPIQPAAPVPISSPPPQGPPSTFPLPTGHEPKHPSPTPTVPLLALLSTAIIPASPATLLPCSSPAPPRSHITPPLQQLATTLSLSTRFHSAIFSRPLRPAERGHWLVETRRWPVLLQREFWEYLRGFVEGGQAGWGVTCFREDDEGRETVDDGDDDDGRAEGLGVVRVYCWGEVVGHVYLLLFVASQSKVKRTGARWVDAGGLTVVEMP